MPPWTTPLLTPGGWLHTREEVDQDGPQLGTFLDGRPIPEDDVFGHWDLIGEDSLVLKSVAIMYDLAGEVVQVSTSDGLAWENLTFGLRCASEPSPLTLDYGLGAAIRMGRNHSCGYTAGTRSGKPTVQISSHEDDPGGLALGDYLQNVSRTTWRGGYSMQRRARFFSSSKCSPRSMAGNAWSR